MPPPGMVTRKDYTLLKDDQSDDERADKGKKKPAANVWRLLALAKEEVLVRSSLPCWLHYTTLHFKLCSWELIHSSVMSVCRCSPLPQSCSCCLLSPRWQCQSWLASWWMQASK